VQVPPPEALKASLANLLASSQQAAATSESSLRKHRDAAAALDARLSDANTALLRLKEELKAKRDEIVARVLDGGEMESFQVRVPYGIALYARCVLTRVMYMQAMLDEKEKDVQAKAAEVANVNALINVVQRSIAHAHEKNECILCERPFVANEAANFFGVQQQAVQVDLPTARGEHEMALAEANNAIAALVRARPLWEECQKLKDRDIPKAEELHKGCV